MDKNADAAAKLSLSVDMTFTKKNKELDKH